MSFLVAAYVYLDTNGTFLFPETRVFLNYNMLADAFLAKQLHLKISPHPGRIYARDPTDPSLPYPYIIDAIIWHGQHYFTQDPVPALVHAALWTLARGLFPAGPPTGLMVIVFAAGCLIGLWLILRIFQQALAPDQEWILWLTWVSFGLSGAQLFIVSRPVVYNEAIAAGMFFTVWGTYCFLWGTLKEKPVLWLSVAASLWSLGVGSRITLVFYPAVFVMCGLYVALSRGEGKLRIGFTAAAMIGPVAVTVFLLLFYNYYRFGDFLDFGRTHITVPAKYFHVYLTVMNNSFRLVHVPYNLYHYFLSLPEFSLRPPFLLEPYYDIAYTPRVLMSREMVSSFLFTMPVLVFAIPSRTLVETLREKRLEALLLSACAAASLLSFFFLLSYYRAVSRYLYEFTPLLFPVILCNVAVRWRHGKRSAASGRLLEVGIVLIFALNVFCGICLGLNGMRR